MRIQSLVEPVTDTEWITISDEVLRSAHGAQCGVRIRREVGDDICLDGEVGRSITGSTPERQR
jgi:hypothetical protein